VIDWNDYVSGGTGPPKLTLLDWDGNTIEEITLPQDAGGAIKEGFIREGDEVTTISGRVVSWVHGFRYRVILPYKYLLLGDYKKLVRIFCWSASGRGRLRFFPHSDCQNIAYWVLPKGDFRFEYARGKMHGYEGEVILEGCELLAHIPVFGENYHFLGGSASLDFGGGGGSRVKIAHHDSLNPKDALTIDMWVMLDSLPSSGEHFFLHSKGEGIEGLSVDSDGYLTFSPRAGVSVTTAQPLQSATPYLLSAVYDGEDTEKAYIFVDGVKMGEAPTSGDLTSNESPIKLGCDAGNGNVHDGKLDEYRRTHSVLYISNGCHPATLYKGYSRLRPFGRTTVLFHFDEYDGDDLHDAGSYGNDGVREGGSKPVWWRDFQFWTADGDYSDAELCHYSSVDEGGYGGQDRLTYYNSTLDVMVTG